jgi:transcriptional regulator with XRE-family HTH domain
MLGVQLSKARERAGFTPGQAASRLGFHRSYIVKIEQGKKKLPFHHLMAFAELYGTSLTVMMRQLRENAYLEEAERRYLDEGFFGEE